MKKNWRSVLPIALSLIYGVSPVDLIPDILPILGQLDDAAVIGLSVLFVLVRQYQGKRTARPKSISA